MHLFPNVVQWIYKLECPNLMTHTLRCFLLLRFNPLLKCRFPIGWITSHDSMLSSNWFWGSQAFTSPPCFSWLLADQYGILQHKERDRDPGHGPAVWLLHTLRQQRNYLLWSLTLLLYPQIIWNLQFPKDIFILNIVFWSVWFSNLLTYNYKAEHEQSLWFRLTPPKI